MMAPLETSRPYRRRSIAPTPAVISIPPWSSSAPEGGAGRGTRSTCAEGGGGGGAAPGGGIRGGMPARGYAWGYIPGGIPGGWCAYPGTPGTGNTPVPMPPPMAPYPGGPPCTRPPRMCPPPPRAPEIVAATPGASAAPPPNRDAPLPGMGMENTERGRPAPVAPWFALLLEPWFGPRRGVLTSPPLFFVILSARTSPSRFFSPPPGIEPAPAPASFALSTALALRRLAVLFSPACLRFIQRTRSATSRTPFAGRCAAIFTYRHSPPYADSAYV